MPLPPHARLLDPREFATGIESIADSVRIPLSELDRRVHELPPRHGLVLVADVGDAAEGAVELLRNIGREAEVISDWHFGDTGPSRLWGPNPFLMQVAAELKPGAAVDLGCGSGRDAVALAGLGWDVVAVDHLPDALTLGRDLADRYITAEEANRIDWVCADLEDGAYEIPSGVGLVTMAWYLNRPLIRTAAQALAVAGSLVIETFTSHHREVYGKPRTEAFVLQRGELRDLPLEIRTYEEDWHDGRHSLRAWFTKPV